MPSATVPMSDGPMSDGPVSAGPTQDPQTGHEVVDDGGVTSPLGYRAAGVCCGLKQDTLDLALLVSDRPASLGGVFTSNKIQAAPVLYSRRVVASGVARAVIANSSNANACTGEPGLHDAHEMAALCADELGLLSSQVLVASTGVIGVPMQMEALRSGIPKVVEKLGPSDLDAAQAILTTDTVVKRRAVRVTTAGGEITIGGIAKGAGMIQPNMATTLCFLTTDAALAPEVVQRALAAAIEGSFNRVTIDGDTSTNDCAFLLANGASGISVEEDSADLVAFQTALEDVCVDLAKMLVRDGEGATKLVEVTVEGAVDEIEARRAAFTIANSPLVKTALYGCQVNWGRVIAAAGRADVEMSEGDSKVWFNRHLVAENGMALELDLSAVTRELAAPEVAVRIDLGVGAASATVWTCDLSEDYIRINGSYIS